MQIPCAYCKELGHHIRNCAKLEEKNRCNKMREKNTIQVKVVIPSAPKYKQQNLFADLYHSSDDEVEDGEIVEDRSHRFSRLSICDSDSESKVESVVEKEWTRSGIKGVVIPVSNTTNYSSSDNDCDYERITKSLAAMSAYVDKFRGRSWADIEFDSDLE